MASPIKLTRAEYEMLVAFVTNPGEILSRERLLRMLSARRVKTLTCAPSMC